MIYNKMSLGKLFNKFGTDKSIKHKYDSVYEKFFEPIKYNKLNILEIGVWRGSGTLAFHEYFPSATIYGLDTFQRIPMENIVPYKLERCKLIKANSQQPYKNKLPDIKFDIIIDDAKHTPRANMLTFRNSIDMLADDGQYFIEDVMPIDEMTIIEMQHEWVKENPAWYNHDANNKFLNELKKSNKKIERFDLRKLTGEPDSYIIRATNI